MPNSETPFTVYGRGCQAYYQFHCWTGRTLNCSRNQGNNGLPVKTPKTALEDTRQLRENATNEIPRLRKMMLENYIDDTRTVEILIDSIQDLVIQAYEKYHKEIVDIVNKERLQQNSDENPIDGLMEVEGLIAWFGDIVGDMHRDQNNVNGESRENETVISE